MRISIILSLLLVGCSRDALSMRVEYVQKAKDLEHLQLYHENKEFYVKEGSVQHKVKKYFVDKIMQDVSDDFIKVFLNCGYLKLSKLSSGEFAVRSYGRIEGDGPIAGAIGFWGTKALCYGTIGAAAVGATVATGGAVGAAGAVAMGSAGVGGAVATAGGSLATAIVTEVIVGAGGAAVAGEAVAAVGTAAGGAVGLVTGIESASVTIGAILGACPFLP